MRNMKKIVLSILLVTLLGCKVKENTLLEHSSTSTQVGRVLVDSIAVKDSIIIREKCDTIFFTKYRTLYKERIRHDTIIKCDTVYNERLITVKEKQPGKSLWWMVLLAVVAVLWKVGLFDLLRKVILK